MYDKIVKNINKVKNVATLSPSEGADFSKILDSLKTEVSISRELVTRNLLLTEFLKPLPLEECGDLDCVRKEPHGMIDLLWREIHFLRETNDILRKTVVHLNTIIE